MGEICSHLCAKIIEDEQFAVQYAAHSLGGEGIGLLIAGKLLVLKSGEGIPRAFIDNGTALVGNRLCNAAAEEGLSKTRAAAEKQVG
ncbi:MAG: hypothetical protein J6P94_05185 [Oscillospiraceae bacterium]|nr:hypothetical protein [Oscillospiraceae bacterium]